MKIYVGQFSEVMGLKFLTGTYEGKMSPIRKKSVWGLTITSLRAAMLMKTKH